MANHFELPVFIIVKASRWLKIWLYIIHLLAVLVILMTGLTWPVKYLLIFICCTGLFYVIRNYILLTGKNSIIRLLLNHVDEWWLTTAQGDTVNATLLPGALVHPMLVILPFRSQSGKHTVILSPDVINNDMLRRLRVRLKYPKTGD